MREELRPEALLLIDIQNDYFPGGMMEVSGSLEASLRAREVLDFFREKRMPVIHVRHVSVRAGASFFLPALGVRKFTRTLSLLQRKS